MLARFNLPLRHPVWSGYATVMVYATNREMVAAAKPYGWDGSYPIEAIWQASRCQDHPCTLDHRFLGMMRLVTPIETETLVHECLHAAITAHHRNQGRLIVIDRDDDHLNPRVHHEEPDEMLAYAVGNLAATCLAKLATLADQGVTVTP